MAEGVESGGYLRKIAAKIGERFRRKPAISEGVVASVASEINESQTILSPDQFQLDPDTEDEYRRYLLNPRGAVDGPRLIGDDEKVVTFTGSFDQFVDFIKTVQDKPVRRVQGETGSDSRFSGVLRRTGVQIIEGFIPGRSEKSAIWPVVDPKGLPTRLEIVGASSSDDDASIALLFPPTRSYFVPHPGAISRDVRQQEEQGWITERQKADHKKLLGLAADNYEHKLPTVDYVTQNPYLDPRDRDAISASVETGAIMFLRTNNELASGRPLNDRLTVISRSPSPQQRIGDLDLSVRKGNAERLKPYTTKLIVPAASAINLKSE